MGLKPYQTDDEFIALYVSHGPEYIAKLNGQEVHNVRARRKKLEARYNKPIVGPDKNRNWRQTKIADELKTTIAPHPGRLTQQIKEGQVLVASDAHYWPGEPSTMHRALVHAVKKFQPTLIIMNGDVVDMAAVSRHPPIGWEKQPTVQEEIETAQERLHEIVSACPKARRVWTLGNHDGRFETRLATVAPEYAKIAGVHLRDHFPEWEPCWSVWINDDVVVKHRFKGGDHATFNNTVKSGTTMITGHLHSAQVRPFTDYNGTRFGVDTGCLADPEHRAFLDYTEDNPKNWVSAFAMCTFKGGELLWPELITKWGEGRAQFRGHIYEV